MSDKVECPFCGERFAPFENCARAEHPRFAPGPYIQRCPLEGKQFLTDNWNMRPPKKEQPSAFDSFINAMPAYASEVEWLRQLVRDLVIEEPTQNYRIDYGPYCSGTTAPLYPSNFATNPEEIYAKRDGTGPDKDGK